MVFRISNNSNDGVYWGMCASIKAPFPYKFLTDSLSFFTFHFACAFHLQSQIYLFLASFFRATRARSLARSTCFLPPFSSFKMANPPNLNVSSFVPRSSRARNCAGVVPSLRPLESRHEAIIFEVNEEALRWNYDIPPSVQLFYQNPETRSIGGDDITLFQRMFMAGLRLPFSEIARDFILFLMVGSSQVIPNAWRYLFASYILWKTMLRSEMSIRQFFNIYRPRKNLDDTVELTVRHPLIFIWLKKGYSNNKFWEQ
jgi:hypothetical protein